MAGIGAKIKDALTPGSHRQDNTYANQAGGPMIGSNVDNTSNRNILSEPNTYPSEGVGGASSYGGNVGTNTGYAQTGMNTTGAGVGGVARAVEGTVCETRTFTEVEDRPVMRERVERIIEHRPVEKQFVVETRPVGERELTDRVHYESAGVREYEVDRVAGSACPTTTGAGAGTNNVL